MQHDTLSFRDLCDFERELTDSVYAGVEVANDVMIRIDYDTFVSNKAISFDIDATDRAISLFAINDVVAIKDVTSFTSFPYVQGAPWNLFLLESFLRHFSRKFTYQSLKANSSNTGAIVRKSAKFSDYIASLAYVIVQNGVSINEKSVGDFLKDKGYIARRSSALPKVVSAARLLAQEIA